MEIFGNTYAFLATVEAVTTIAKACPDHDINKLDIWIGDSIVSVSNALKVMAPAMSKAYHDVQKELDPTYEGRILSPRLIDLMTIDQVFELMAEVNAAYASGNETEVETRSKEKKEEEAAAST